MRHGLIRWREDELSAADIERRQERLRDAMRERGLDALVVYTNHVRSAGVTWATGFTPYWAHGLLLLPLEGRPYFAISLSPRGKPWLTATNPTAEVATSPRPGAAVRERLGQLGARRLGIVEPGRLPGDLARELTGPDGPEAVDATDLFADVRAESDGPERALVAQVARLAEQAFAAIPASAATAEEAVAAVELAARYGGAEEVYMAAAPDLARETRFARSTGETPLGQRFALRATLARHGAWVRWSRSFARDGGPASDMSAAEAWFVQLAGRLTAGPGVAAAIESSAPPAGLTLEHWLIEAPVATRPLQIVAESGADPAGRHAAANLTVRLRGPSGSILLAGPLQRDEAP